MGKTIGRSTMAWARDQRSFDSLKELLGEQFAPRKHRPGVDVAFALPVRPPTAFPDRLREWLDERQKPVVGLNVSGLIHGRPGAREDRRRRFDSS